MTLVYILSVLPGPFLRGKSVIDLHSSFRVPIPLIEVDVVFGLSNLCILHITIILLKKPCKFLALMYV